MTVKCLSSDYDGTISPLDASRTESRVPLETRVMLRRIGNFLPISIVTMKDLSFIMPRTPFAQAWSGIGGLETRIGRRVVKQERIERKLPAVTTAARYAKSCDLENELEIEEKQDSEGRIVAFCVDWRRARNFDAAQRKAADIADFCQSLKLRVIRYEKQPFFDVYPIVPDKGRALRNMLTQLAVKMGVLYLGDSETDNPAFRTCGVGVGVVHDESRLETLDCDYFVDFEQVPDFLHDLLRNGMRFSTDFPMVRPNLKRF